MVWKINHCLLTWQKSGKISGICYFIIGLLATDIFLFQKLLLIAPKNVINDFCTPYAHFPIKRVSSYLIFGCNFNFTMSALPKKVYFGQKKSTILPPKDCKDLGQCMYIDFCLIEFRFRCRQDFSNNFHYVKH